MSGSELYTILPVSGKIKRYSKAESAYAYYLNKRVNLITGNEESFVIFDWLKSLDKIQQQSKRVIHLMYDLGFLFETSKELDTELLLAIDITYSKREILVNGPTAFSNRSAMMDLQLKDSIAFDDYKERFESGYKELLAGNCYQFNLTTPFIYSFEKDYSPLDFIFKLWEKKENRGAYAHATYVPIWQKLFLSNSPECLFQIKEEDDSLKLWTMPIKGTVPLSGPTGFKKAWKGLCECTKNESELNMITDLLRNDLSRIEEPIAKVVGKKLPLTVPGILHQYSLVDVKLSKDITLYQILKALFPGGSITGAPKKRVMTILDRIESRDRAFYCGSTLVFDESIMAASINIRSSVIDFEKKKLVYDAGGGITLKSTVKDEFDEMKRKVSSFIDLLN